MKKLIFRFYRSVFTRLCWVATPQIMHLSPRVKGRIFFGLLSVFLVLFSPISSRAKYKLFPSTALSGVLFEQCDIIFRNTVFPIDIGNLGVAALMDGSIVTGGFFVTPGYYKAFPRPESEPPSCFFIPAFTTRLTTNKYLDFKFSLDGRMLTADFDNLIEMDPVTGALGPVIAAGIPALGITVDPTNGDIYVSRDQTITRVVLNPPSSALFATIPTGIGVGMDGIAITCDGKTLLASMRISGTIARIDIDRTGPVPVALPPSLFVKLPLGSTERANPRDVRPGPDGIAFGRAGTLLDGWVYTNNNDGSIHEISFDPVLTSFPSGFVTLPAPMRNSRRRGDFLSVDFTGHMLVTQVGVVTRISLPGAAAGGNANNSMINFGGQAGNKANVGGAWVVPGANPCENLRCALVVAEDQGCLLALAQGESDAQANKLKMDIRNICDNFNLNNPDSTQMQICALIDQIKNNSVAASCPSLLLALEGLRNATEKFFPGSSTCL